MVSNPRSNLIEPVISGNPPTIAYPSARIRMQERS